MRQAQGVPTERAGHDAGDAPEMEVDFASRNQHLFCCGQG
jgi:hypothetical protein